MRIAYVVDVHDRFEAVPRAMAEIDAADLESWRRDWLGVHPDGQFRLVSSDLVDEPLGIFTPDE